MKKTKSTSKLALAHQTIRTLQLIEPHELAKVNGGQTVPPPTSTNSCNNCVPH